MVTMAFPVVLVGWFASASTTLLMAGNPSSPAEPAHAHPHAQTAAVAQVTLNAGQKWQTDASLRSGMAAIRKTFDADHPAVHQGKETDAQYNALATAVETEVNTIIANCKLPKDADANLHFVIADLLQGVNWMRGKDADRVRHDGAERIHGALRAYAKNFDDPTWAAAEPMKH